MIFTLTETLLCKLKGSCRTHITIRKWSSNEGCSWISYFTDEKAAYPYLISTKSTWIKTNGPHVEEIPKERAIHSGYLSGGAGFQIKYVLTVFVKRQLHIMIVIIVVSCPFVQDILENSAAFVRSFSHIRSLVIVDMRGSWIPAIAGLAV